MSRCVLLDTNLLVLLVVGLTSERLVGVHKRTQAYDRKSFELLRRVLANGAAALATTPHILAETSNLASQCGEPARGRIAATLAQIIASADERYLTSRIATEHAHYARLGLTDAAILALLSSEMILLTDDALLHDAASRGGFEAVNFGHLQEAQLYR